MTASKEIETRTSLELLQTIFSMGGFGRGIGETLGLRGISAEIGKVVVEGTPTQDHHNPHGAVHGGYIATLLDAAMGLAVQTQLDVGVRFATTNLNITYLRAVTGDIERLRAEANILHAGRKQFVTEAKIVDLAGNVYAHGVGTFRAAS